MMTGIGGEKMKYSFANIPICPQSFTQASLKKLKVKQKQKPSIQLIPQKYELKTFSAPVLGKLWARGECIHYSRPLFCACLQEFSFWCLMSQIPWKHQSLSQYGGPRVKMTYGTKNKSLPEMKERFPSKRSQAVPLMSHVLGWSHLPWSVTMNGQLLPWKSYLMRLGSTNLLTCAPVGPGEFEEDP